MTREEHFAKSQELRDQARAALHASYTSGAGFNRVEWEKYKRLSKEANRHYGIANAMWTRSMKRINATIRSLLQPKEVKS